MFERALQILLLIIVMAGSQCQAKDTSNHIYVSTEAFDQLGTWIFDGGASGAFGNVCLRGISPTGTSPIPEESQPAVSQINVEQGGTYRVWVRSRDYATRPGTRFFQMDLNGQVLDAVFGRHGVNGWAWESGGTVELPAGTVVLELLDTSAYYARMDSILLTTDLNLVPPNTYEELIELIPQTNELAQLLQFPEWTKDDREPVEVETMRNDYFEVKFYRVVSDQGTTIQKEIWINDGGEWFLVSDRDDAYGYLLLYAKESAIVSYKSQYPLWQQTFTFDGRDMSKTTGNIYEAGLPSWLIPASLQRINEQTILLGAENDYATLEVVWQLGKEEKLPQVTCRIYPKCEGYLSLGIFNQEEKPLEQTSYLLNPFRINSKRLPEEPYLVTEQFSPAALSLMTLPREHAPTGQKTTYGVVVDPSSIPYRWVYAADSQWGLGIRGPVGGVLPSLFAPLFGQEDAKFLPGDSYEITYRPVYVLGDWYDAYRYVVEELFEVGDYRRNYYSSLTEAGFNIQRLILDDQYGGWDPYMKAHYNMEGRNVVSQANALVHLQSYLLTEDPQILETRAIPTIAYLLTRGGMHFAGEGLHNRGTAQGLKFAEPHPIGQPMKEFGTDVYGGAYLFTRGLVPALRQIGLDKGVKSRDVGFVPAWVQYLWMYNYTKENWYLDVAKRGADSFLANEVYASKYDDPGDTFINIWYVPYWTALLDIYEACGEEKYLEGAAEGARRLMATLWIQPKIPDGKMTVAINEEQIIWEDFWWNGDRQQRVGFAEDTKTMLTPVEPETVPAWVPARIGLGIEQPGTFRGGERSKNSKNITATQWAPDLLRLAKYTGDHLFEIFARNAVIGRFANYPGYYYNQFTVHQMKADFPYTGPDTTNIYYHHIPTYLSLVQDFLITQAWSWSDGRINFPAVRQQGYVWFTNKHYGFAPGRFFDEDAMWLWQKEGLIEVDNLQIDWIGVRKDGKAGFALMNEDVIPITTTITLGNELTGGTGKVTIYTSAGDKYWVEIRDSKLTLEIPGHDLVGMILEIPDVLAPAYAEVPLDTLRRQPPGLTIAEPSSFWDFGRGIVLQMDPKMYYAYVYVINLPDNTEGVTLYYRIGDGFWEETHSVVYPYEFLIPVSDTTNTFEYYVEIADKDGAKKTSSTKHLKPLL